MPKVRHPLIALGLMALGCNTAPSHPPIVDTFAATAITLTEATLNGSVIPNGSAVTCHFDYGVTGAYGSATPPQALGSGMATFPVHAVVTGLSAGTYHFRLACTTATASYDGTDASFNTTTGGSTFAPGTICNSSGTALTPPAQLKHVILIIMENKDYGSVEFNNAAPYFNSLVAKCGYATHFLDNCFAGDQLSLPHYLALTSGSNCDTGLETSGTGCINDDNDPSSHVLTTPAIFGQVPSWTAYEESMPSACAGSSSGDYATKHNPPPYYTTLNSVCSGHDVPLAPVTCPTTVNTPCGTPSNPLTQDLANDTLPAFAFVTPNLNNDMHNGTVSQGDNWLQTYLPLIFNSPAYLRGEVAVDVVWDEQGSFSSGPVPNLFISPYLQPTVTTVTMNLFSVLRTIEEQLGQTTFLGCAGGTPPGGTGTCPTGSSTDLRPLFNF